jgi:hypothetical protein
VQWEACLVTTVHVLDFARRGERALGDEIVRGHEAPFVTDLDDVDVDTPGSRRLFADTGD